MIEQHITQCSLYRGMEEWKLIKGYNDYEISSYGRVKSLKFNKERILKPGINSGGYYSVNLYKDKIRTIHNVQQLVAISFLHHKPNGYIGLVVDHIDNDKLNNRLDNLQLITSRENSTKNMDRGSSKYVGVHWCKKDHKWRSSIYINGRNTYIGNFDDEYEAHLAYQRSLKKLETKYV